MFPRIARFPVPDFLRGFLPEYITIYSYGVLIAVGVLVSFYVALRKVRPFGLDSNKLSDLYIIGIVAAFVGGKLFFFLEDPQRYASDPSEMLNLRGGGFVFYGSLLFAVPSIIWWVKRQKVDVRSFLDVLAFVGPIVHSFGRLGCFMAGCCYGTSCPYFFGVTFDHPESLAKPLHSPLYPTQLFDIVVNLVILLLVFRMEKRKQFRGQLFLIYLMLYAVGRSVVELFRGDEARGFVIEGVLTHSQFIAALILLVCAYFWKRWSLNK